MPYLFLWKPFLLLICSKTHPSLVIAIHVFFSVPQIALVCHKALILWDRCYSQVALKCNLTFPTILPAHHREGSYFLESLHFAQHLPSTIDLGVWHLDLNPSSSLQGKHGQVLNLSRPYIHHRVVKC